MNYVKNVVKILLLIQCLLLCTCDKEVVTTEQHRLNLADFVTCPFNEKFDNKTNLEKYVLKKFGEPDSVRKGRKNLGEHRKEWAIVTDWIEVAYQRKYTFRIYRGVNKRLEFFDMIFFLEFTDLKYEINNETTIKDIKRLFGKPRDVTDIEDVYDINYYYSYSHDSPYLYHLEIIFRKGKLSSMYVYTIFDPYRL